MANAVNRDAICNCLFRYLKQIEDCCNRTDVVEKIANIVNKFVLPDVLSCCQFTIFDSVWFSATSSESNSITKTK